MLLLSWLVGCGTPAPAEIEPPAPSCVDWQVGPIQLSPQVPATRHHPTAAWQDDGFVVTWQIGKQVSTIGTRAFDAGLIPKGPEGTVVMPAELRYTHPQVAADATGAWYIWSQDDNGALLTRHLLPNMKPAGPPTVVGFNADTPTPALYPDLTMGGDGVPWTTWYDAIEGKPGWSVARVDQDPATRIALPTLEDTNAGGPGTIAYSESEGLWAVWPERLAAEPAEARIRAAKLTYDAPPTAVTLHTSHTNDQRTALAFAGDRLVSGWTQYPTANLPWGVSLGVFGQDGTTLVPPRRLDAGGGRMLDVVAQDGVVIASWEGPESPEGSRALWLARYGADLTPDCTPERVYPGIDDDQTRAQLLLKSEGDTLRGIVIWQTGPNAARQTVWARSFTTPARALPPLPEPAVEQAEEPEGEAEAL